MTAKEENSRDEPETVFFQKLKTYLYILKVKIWFQNRRSKYKKLMKQGGVSVKTENGEGSPPNSDTEGMNGYVQTFPPRSL